MNDFHKLIKEAGILSKIRNIVPEKDKELFDKIVEEKIKEYTEIWTNIQPTIEKYKTGEMKPNADKSSDK